MPKTRDVLITLSVATTIAWDGRCPTGDDLKDILAENFLDAATNVVPQSDIAQMLTYKWISTTRKEG